MSFHFSFSLATRVGPASLPPPPVPRRKPAVSPAAHSWHGELVGAWKAEINSWQRRIWCSSAIKAAGYKKHWPDWLFCRILKALACLIILWVSPASWVSSSWELECCCFLMPWCTVFITLFVHHPFSHPPTAYSCVWAEWQDLEFTPHLDSVSKNEDIFNLSWTPAILSSSAGASFVLSYPPPSCSSWGFLFSLSQILLMRILGI